MVSIEDLKKALNKNGENYTDEEVKEIRDFLYLVGQIAYENFMLKKRNNTLNKEFKINSLKAIVNS